MADGQLRTEIQYGGETTYGTEAATTQEIGKVTNFTPTNNNNLIYSRGMGEGRDVSNTMWGNYDCGGSVEWEVHDFAFLKHWIGPQSGAGSDGDPYLLTEDDIVGVTTNDIQAFSLEANYQNTSSDDTDTYTGCVGNSFTLNGSIGSVLTCSADFVAQKVTSSTTGTVYTPVTTNPWIMVQSTIKWGSAPTTVAGIQSFSISYANNLIVNRSATSRFISIPVAGLRDYKFTLLVKMESAIATTLRDDFYGQSNIPIAGTADANPTANLEFKIEFTEGSSSADRNAYVWLDQCSIDDIGKPVAIGGELVVLEVSGTAKTGRSNAPISWWTVA